MRKIIILITIMILSFLVSCDDEPNRVPTVTISADITSGVCPLTVRFTADASDPDGNSLTFAWDFGDGTGTSTEQNPTYVYSSAGVFTVTCTVTDNGSPQKSATATLLITTEANIPVLTGLHPSWKVTHMPKFTLTLTGSSFVNGAKVYFGGVEKTATFIDSGTLEVTILPDDTLVDSYTYKGDAVSSTAIQVTVTNPGTGGGYSDPLDFQIYSNHRFSEPEMMTENTYKVYGSTAQIIKVDNRFYFGWQAEISNNKVGMFKYSDDGAANWSEGRQILYGGTFPSSTVYAPDGAGTLYSLLKSGDYSIAFSKSTDTGVTWSDPLTIFTQTELEFDYDYSVYTTSIVKTAGGTLCALGQVYKHNEDGFKGYTNYLMRSTDEGATWSTPETVFHYPDKGSSDPSSMIVDKNGRLIVIYLFGTHPLYMDKYYLSYSDDDGETWSGRILLYHKDSMKDSTTFFLFPNGDFGMVLTKKSSGNYYLSFYRRAQDADNWTKLSDIITLTTYTESAYVKVDSAGNINIVYWSGTSSITDTRVYYIRSIDGGWTWTPPIQLTTEDTKTKSGVIALDDEGNMYIVYQRLISPYEGYLLKSIK